MITSLIEVLELLDFGQYNIQYSTIYNIQNTISYESRDKILLMTSLTKVMMS